MGMDRLKRTSQAIEAMNRNQEGPEAEMRPRQHRRTTGPRFEERHQRVTTYLENDLFRQIESLREQGKILSITALFNEALRAYVQENYGK